MTDGGKDTHQSDSRGPCSLFQSHAVQFPQVELGMDLVGSQAPRWSVCWYGVGLEGVLVMI